MEDGSPADARLPDVLQAAPGHEFVVLVLGEKPASNPYVRGVRHEFVVDGRVVAVRNPFQDTSRSGMLVGRRVRNSKTKAVGYLICVPTGRPVLFRVTDDGQTRELDCRTGAVR